jgi:hypothetical protein
VASAVGKDIESSQEEREKERERERERKRERNRDRALDGECNATLLACIASVSWERRIKVSGIDRLSVVRSGIEGMQQLSFLPVRFIARQWKFQKSVSPAK